MILEPPTTPPDTPDYPPLTITVELHAPKGFTADADDVRDAIDDAAASLGAWVQAVHLEPRDEPDPIPEPWHPDQLDMLAELGWADDPRR